MVKAVTRVAAQAQRHQQKRTEEVTKAAAKLKTRVGAKVRAVVAVLDLQV